jgi:uridine kinase
MELTDALFDLCRDVQQPIIAIDGPAGAGKTTLAEHLRTAMSLKYRVNVIHMDSLYNGWENPFDHHLTEGLITAVASHKKGGSITLPQYDWIHHRYGSSQEFPAAQLMILEGVGSFHTTIRSDITASIWVDIDPERGLERVISRDGESISLEMKLWLTLQEQHFASEGSEKAADFVLTT